MKIKIQLDFENLFDSLKQKIGDAKKTIKYEDEILGYIIAIFHLMISCSVIFLIFVSHTIYPSVWLKAISFIVLFIIWIQHILLDACFVTLFEKKLVKESQTPFHKILSKILNVFNLTIEQYDKYLIVIEGVIIGCFGLELLSHFSQFMTNRA
jgi:hypothetical protein